MAASENRRGYSLARLSAPLRRGTYFASDSSTGLGMADLRSAFVLIRPRFTMGRFGRDTRLPGPQPTGFFYSGSHITLWVKELADLTLSEMFYIRSSPTEKQPTHGL